MNVTRWMRVYREAQAISFRLRVAHARQDARADELCDLGLQMILQSFVVAPAWKNIPARTDG
jgi:hypothetical protein